MKTALVGMMIATLAAAGCGKKNDEAAKTAPESAGKTTAQPATPPAPPPDPADFKTIVVQDVGLSTPESVLYVPDRDVYLVSNIVGSPLEADGKAFISVLSPEGKVETLKWIDGEAKGVTLNAPKGMAIADGVLHVADLDHVRMFDAASGAPRGAVAIPGATFLNDVAVHDGVVYVSDSGLKAGKDGFAPSGTDAIWAIRDGKATPLIQGDELGRPNGLLATDEGLMVVTFGTGELYRVSYDGQKSGATKLLHGQLDGIVGLPDGRYAISSWAGKAVLIGESSVDMIGAIAGVESPADLGYDSKRHRLIIPVFTGDAVQIHPLRRD